MIKLQLESLGEKEGLGLPVLATFPQNIPLSLKSQNVQVQPELDLTFKMYQNQQSRKKKQKILVGENDAIKIVGKNFGEDNQLLQNQKYVLGVLNPGEKEMKLIEIDHSFLMRQYIKQITSLEEVSSNIAQSGTSMMNQKQMLVQQFGTVKSQQKVAQMLNNVVEAKNISGKETITEFFKERSNDIRVKLDQQTEESKTERVNSLQEILPDFNLDAKQPSDIYKLHSIISMEDWNQIKAEPFLVALQKRKLAFNQVQFMSQFVKNTMLNFQQNFESRNMQKFSILQELMYLDVLIKTYFKAKLNTDNLEEISKEFNIEPCFVKNILQKFYQAIPSKEQIDQFSYIRPSHLKDKLTSYIIVLSLIIFDFQFDAAPLALQLKIETSQFILFAKEIGCSISLREQKGAQKDAKQLEIELKKPPNPVLNNPKKQ